METHSVFFFQDYCALKGKNKIDGTYTMNNIIHTMHTTVIIPFYIY